ncbi:MAG TPA: hypothetical protein VKS79_13360 [Gemmataceae bacterium]|nr:hypothetical protein [Gemmataceae bacterium]
MNANLSPEADSEDGLDRLLRSYFQAEMTKSKFAPPEVAGVAPARLPQQRATLFRSRIVLALSLLLVLSGLWLLLGNRSRSSLPVPAGMNNSAAERHDPFQPAQPARPDSSPHR